MNAEAELGAIQAWFRMRNDHIWFGYTKLRFDSTTIKDIICNAQIPWAIIPCPCPIDPSLPMRPRNVAILSLKAFTLLIKLWQHTFSRAFYIAFVQRCNLVPPRFDVAFPCDPYVNTDYVRPIIDVGPILIAEQLNVITATESSDHSNMQQLAGEDLDTTAPSDEYIVRFSRSPPP
jgi:hypothetical protein